jgi:hypothetical protein
VRQLEWIFDGHCAAEPALLVFEQGLDLSNAHDVFFVVELFRVESKEVDPQGARRQLILRLPNAFLNRSFAIPTSENISRATRTSLSMLL